MKVLKVLMFVFAGLFAVFFFVKDRIVINPTASMPIGIYWRYDKPVLERGDIVLACLPDSQEARLFIERGYLYGVSCPGGRGKVLKTIQGMPGDDVVINQFGVSINGKRIANSLPQSKDRFGRKMPQTNLHRKLKDNEYILIGNHPLSLDSRYLGPIMKSQILFSVKPLHISKRVIHIIWG